jgi:hypothetical protein
MARHTPTHEPPEIPDEDFVSEKPPPGGRQLLRMFLPVAAAIVVFITALMLVLKFLVIPAMDRGDPTAQTRALATIGALQTQEALTRSQRALTPQPTPQTTSTPRPLATAQPVNQPTAAPTAVGAAPATGIQASTSVAVTVPTNSTTSALATLSPATPVQRPIDTGNVPTQPDNAAGPAPIPTVDPVAEAEVQQAYAHYWQQRTLAFRDLDPSLLNDVAAGPELAGLTSEIDQLRSQGRAIRTHVVHHIVALPTAPGEAVVADQYEDLSTYIDFATKEPIDPANADPQSGPVTKVREVLQKIDGMWKVTGGQVYE